MRIEAEAEACVHSEDLTDTQQHECSEPGPAYANVLGVHVSAVNMRAALELADEAILSGDCNYICLTGVHGVIEAAADPGLRRTLNSSLLNLPDGMPMTWVGRLQGHRAMDRVFGPDFMFDFCLRSMRRGYRHYLYGGQPDVAGKLRDTLRAKFPGLQVVGIRTPPFRDLTFAEEQDLFLDLQNSRPDIIWIGISTPRQERFMARYRDRFQVPLMVGVGAAFDYCTGRIRDCPFWVKRAGLQWLHRLVQDPKRLWRRYLHSHPRFLWKIALQLLRIRKYS